MLISNQYSRRFFWPRLLSPTQTGLDCCNTERLFTVSDKTQAAVCPFSPISLSACSLRFSSPQGTVQRLFSNPPRCFLCAFTSMIKFRVPMTKDTTNKRATVLNATGCRWMKYSGRASSSFSVAHVPVCVFTREPGAGQSKSSMTATNDDNHCIFTYLYKKKVFS